MRPDRLSVHGIEVVNSSLCSDSSMEHSSLISKPCRMDGPNHSSTRHGAQPNLLTLDGNFSSNSSECSGMQLHDENMGSSSESLDSTDDGGSNENLVVEHVSEDGDSIDCTFNNDSMRTPTKNNYVDIQTLNPPLNHAEGAVIVSTYLVETTYPWKITNLPGLIQDLQKNDQEQKQAEKRKVVQIQVLPMLAQEQNFSGLAAFLTVTDQQIQTSVVEKLTALLLDLRISQDTKVMEQLLEVAKTCKSVILDMSEDSVNHPRLMSVFLMTISALFSRCPHPTADQCSDLGLSEKQSKKKCAEGLKQMALRVLQESDKSLKEMLTKHTYYQEWTWASFSPQEREKIKTLFGRASFCQIVVHVFTLLNELKNEGWLGNGQMEMTITLREIYQEVSARSGKDKFSDEVKSALDFLLVDGLVSLLRSTFQEEESQVGKHRKQYIPLITDLILDIIDKASSPLQPHLLREAESLSLHNASYVRTKLKKLFSSRKRSNIDLVYGFIEERLKSIGFRRDRSKYQSDSREKERKQCEWQTSPCTIGHHRAEVAFYLRQDECMVKNGIKKCLDEHPECLEKREFRKQAKERSQRHTRNMDMLMKLSPLSPHLVQLYAYQHLPVPFYITEQVEQSRLLSYLLEHRTSKNWLPPVTSYRVMNQGLEALKFLAIQRIDPRNVTAYNMVVQPGVDYRQQSDRTKCSVLMSNDFIVKIADLGLAHEYTQGGTDIRHVHNQGAVPLRWTSPEALFKGRYSEANMVYSAACFMYELWTHGCQPFSSYSMDTELLLKKMLVEPGTVRLTHWPCISPDVYQLIISCTNSDFQRRPSLCKFQEQLRVLHRAERQDQEELGLEASLAMADKYPPLNEDQCRRKHEPETGIPPSVQQLLTRKNSSLYDETRKSMWVQSRRTMVTDEELTVYNPIRFKHHRYSTEVEEVVSPNFVNEVLPSLDVSGVNAATCWNYTDDSRPKLADYYSKFVHKREYPQTMTLYDAAKQGLLVNSSDDGPCRWLFVSISLAKALCQCHENDWAVGDLKASNILINCNNGEVILPRIGRMRQLSASKDYYVDEIFEDSRRWLAQEVLLTKRYGKANDVHMMSTTLWEMLQISDMAARDASASRKDFAPYSNVPKDKVIDHVREGKPLPQPANCPNYIMRLIEAGRHHDPTKRYDAQKFLHVLLEYRTLGPQPSPFLVDPQFSTTPDEDTSKTADAQPMRRQKGRREAKPLISVFFPKTLNFQTIKRHSKRQLSNKLKKSRPEHVQTDVRIVECASETKMENAQAVVKDSTSPIEVYEQFVAMDVGPSDQGHQTSLKTVHPVVIDTESPCFSLQSMTKTEPASMSTNPASGAMETNSSSDHRSQINQFPLEAENVNPGSQDQGHQNVSKNLQPALVDSGSKGNEHPTVQNNLQIISRDSRQQRIDCQTIGHTEPASIEEQQTVFALEAHTDMHLRTHSDFSPSEMKRQDKETTYPASESEETELKRTMSSSSLYESVIFDQDDAECNEHLYSELKTENRMFQSLRKIFKRGRKNKAENAELASDTKKMKSTQKKKSDGDKSKKWFKDKKKDASSHKFNSARSCSNADATCNVARVLSTVYESREAITSHSSVPGSREAITSHSTVPGSREAITSHSTVPGSREAITSHSSVPGSRKAITSHSSVHDSTHAPSPVCGLEQCQDSTLMHSALPTPCTAPNRLPACHTILAFSAESEEPLATSTWHRPKCRKNMKDIFPVWYKAQPLMTDNRRISMAVADESSIRNQVHMADNRKVTSVSAPGLGEENMSRRLAAEEDGSTWPEVCQNAAIADSSMEVQDDDDHGWPDSEFDSVSDEDDIGWSDFTFDSYSDTDQQGDPHYADAVFTDLDQGDFRNSSIAFATELERTDSRHGASDHVTDTEQADSHYYANACVTVLEQAVTTDHEQADSLYSSASDTDLEQADCVYANASSGCVPRCLSIDDVRMFCVKRRTPSAKHTAQQTLHQGKPAFLQWQT